MDITNAAGGKEEFLVEKFCSSLERSGASKELTQKVCGQVESMLHPGMTTEDIVDKAMAILSKESPGIAASYNLKRGIMALGPAGFLFEHYIAAILHAYGYETKLNQMLKGRCVSHEIDIVAEKGADHFLLEAKYHNNPGVKTDVTVAMYAYARLLDITPEEKKAEHEYARHSMWLFTNAKFTTSATQYGTCMGIKMTGWNYPKNRGENLADLIKKKMLFPITTLPSVNYFAREEFARRNILLALDLRHYSEKDLVQQFSLNHRQAGRIAEEVRMLAELESVFLKN